MSAPARPPLSAVLPPLVLGTATFNHQYADPATLPSDQIVASALALGIRAFDTSPYYGPSETLLGRALAVPAVRAAHPRSSYFLVTKAGRVASSSFDYSPAAIRASVLRSIDRLGADYLDLVYCHDCEFVSLAETVAAVAELRALRAEGLVKYVGISGFPVAALADRAAAVLAQTGEPVDAVLSYGHYCVQNTTLGSAATLQAFDDAQVSVLLNASILNMGLLTTRGVDAGPQASWHPSPKDLRTRCVQLAPLAQKAGLGFEDVCIRWALAAWIKRGAKYGSTWRLGGSAADKIGISVLGVTAVAELDASVKAFEDALADKGTEGAERVERALRLVEDEMWPALGEWKDFAWKSPDDDFVNVPPPAPSS